ncbi:hypothetical protein [Polaribacter sp. IC063]|uniref:hypothetical protein n=1 Tax=Polaribacter sp. IC063 TaxID=57031 RepID=UPI0011BF4468|nr:hypothetical protein [Polaribacter sp. IC063]TXD48135.1 hypothetical protein ES043_17990 [Polaribacter sp. IC063]
MRKTILTAVTILIVNLTFGQWTESFYVDEFGEPTTESYKYIISEDGTFSNSATQNSKLKCQFVLGPESLTIKVFEYGSSLATSTEGTFETVKIKTPSGVVGVVKRVFFTKSGSLYFSKKVFEQVEEILQEKGEYMMIFKKSSSYSESSYKINFTI